MNDNKKVQKITKINDGEMTQKMAKNLPKFHEKMNDNKITQRN